jgi:arginase
MSAMRVHLIAVPFDTARRRWRMGAGPEHLLDSGLADRLDRQGHDVTAALVEPRRSDPAEIATAFDLIARVAEQVRSSVDRGAFPLVLSGNCNTAIGTLSGLTPRSRAVAWFDAHGDANTPDTTTTGFLDGTGLAAAMGWCWNGMTRQIPGFAPVNAGSVILIGARDLDGDEASLLDRAGVCRLAPSDVETDRFAVAVSALRDSVAYVHCDLDVLDPVVGRANPFVVPGGLGLAALHSAIHAIGEWMPIAAAAVTAYAPEYDEDGRMCKAALQTVDAIVAAAQPR